MAKASKYFAVYFLAVLCIILSFSTYAHAVSVTLSWDAPVDNEDQTPLTDLGGFIIYYGSSSGNYNITIDVGNVTSYQIGNLSDGQTYYFAVTAYDTSRNESAYSNERSITIDTVFGAEIVVSDSVSPISDLQVPFGNVTEGSSSNQTVTVTNNGNANLVIGSIAQSNPLAYPFTILSDNCSGQTVSASSNCTLTVRFSPSTAGQFSDSFNIPSNDSDESSVTVSVSGSGEAIPLPDITVTDSVAPTDNLQIPFGNVTAGSWSNKTVTVTNNGNANLVIGSIAQSSPLAYPFSILSDYCSGQTVSASSNCTLTVRFSPSTAGQFSDSFNIPSNDPDESSVTVSVSGSGEAIPLPDITVTDSVAPTGNLQIPFGNVTAESLSNKTVTVRNSGNADLVIGSIGGSNPLSTPFSVWNNSCSGQTLSPSSSCTLTVRFAPSGTGSFNDSFDIPSNDPDENPVTMNVNGSGTPPPVPDITVTDSIGSASDLQMPFGDVTEGLLSDHTVTVTNNGSAALVIGTIGSGNSLSAPFSIEGNSCSGQTLSPSSSCTLTVRFAPSGTGSFNDSFDIPSNDPDDNPTMVSLSGSGLSSVVNNPPDEPALVYPAHGQRGLGHKVGFKWKKAKDPDGDMVTYNIQVCQDQNMTTGCITEVNLAYLGQNDIVYAGIGRYGAGLFCLLIGPALIVAARRMNMKAFLIIGIVLIAGMFVVSCGGGGSGSGGSLVTSETQSGTNDEVNYELSGLSSATSYYWAITASDGNGGESTSEVRSFETQ